MNQNYESIAIVGMGCRLPGANSPEELWELLKEGRDMVKPLDNTRWNQDKWSSKNKIKGKHWSHHAALVDDIDMFDPEFFNLSPKEASQMDPQIRLLLEDYMDLQSLSVDTVNSHSIQGNAPTMAANRLSFFLNQNGPSVSYNTACSSSMTALHNAISSLRKKECTWAIVGGCSALLDPRLFVAFTDWGTMSPDGKCFTFDSRANGYVRGEGCACIILKLVSDAIANKDRIYSVIRHSGINHDGHKRAITTPNMTAQLELMKNVYNEIGIDVCSVDYVEAHGTGTVVGDSIETKAIGGALCPQDRQYPLIIGSVKTNLGHLEGAAGIVSIMKTALCIYNKCIPKNLNYQKPNPEIDFQQLKLRVPVTTEMWPKIHDIRRAGVNSFGIGGSNAHIILESIDINNKIITNQKDNYYCLCLQFNNDENYHNYVEKLKSHWINNESNIQILSDICYTLYTKRTKLPYRYCLIDTPPMISYSLENHTLPEITRKWIKGIALEGQNRPIVMVFCGQGTQWKNMGLELYKTSQIFRQTLDLCNEIMLNRCNINLIESLSNDNTINTAIISQPATTAIQISLLELLKSYGILPNVVMGHSSGEIAACYATGCVNIEEAMDLAIYRGVMIEQYCTKDGAMAAIGVNVEKARELIECYDNLYIAAENSPKSVTVSGHIDSINELIKNLSNEGYFVRKLDVNQAYHSKYMDIAMPHYLDKIRYIRSKQFGCKFYSTVYAKEIVDYNEITGAYFTDNLTNPVRFCPTIQQIFNDYPNSVFMEIGPHPTLHRPILQCLEPKINESQIFGTLVKGQDDNLSVKQTILHLYCNGNIYEKPLDEIFPDANQYTNLPLYIFHKTRLWKDSEESMQFLHSPIVHPILGIKEPSIDPIYKSRIDLKEYKYFHDHKILGSLLAPASMYLEMSIAAFKDIFKKNKGCIYYARFDQPLVFNDKEIFNIYTNYNLKGNELQISNSQSPWIEYYKCHLSPDSEDWCIGDTLETILDRLQGETQDISGDKIYSSLSAEGLEFGHTFQTLKSIHKSAKEGWCQIELNFTQEELSKYLFHPALIDTIFQSVISTLNGAPSAFIPVGVNSLSFDISAFDKSSNNIISYVQLLSDSKIIEANVYLYSNHNLFLWARGAKLQSMQASTTNPLNNLLFTQQFEEIHLEQIQEPIIPTSEKPLVLLTSNTSSNLADIMLQFLGDSIIKLDDPSNIPNQSTGYIALFDYQVNVIEPVSIQPLLLLTKALIKNNSTSPLYIITIGGNGNITNPSVSNIIGYGRTLQNEIMKFPCYLFDLDPTESIDIQSEMLSNMLSLDFTHESEIIERAQKLYSIRILPETINEGILPDIEPTNSQWTLDLLNPGLLDTFYRKEFIERDLLPHEILWEVHYSGLNYKDVMIAMGLLKEDAFKGGFTKLNLGLEGSGIVLKVGKDVKKVKVGDKCFGICPQGCGTHAITLDCHLFRIPKHWTSEQASGVFVPYTTAYACSIKANFKSGEHILIHGGSGGVGSCAIQLAHNCGAIVYATASTELKREYCKKLGANYVFNSRDSQFVQEIKKLTKGNGCDVIINCLSNQLMKDSIRLLSPYGRFIELGKTDAMNDNQINIHDLLENQSYIFFDLDRYLEQRMEITTQWGTSMVELLEKNKLLPMDTKVYPVSSIQDAYRYLAQSKHLGKVVIQLKDNTNNIWLPTNLPYLRKLPFNNNGVYVIFGGTKGLGLELTQWMSSLGGNHFILVNRSGQLDAEGNNTIQILKEKYYANIEIHACDITINKQVDTLIKSIKDRKLIIKGIIHSAMLLSDHLISNMTIEQFNISYNTKAIGLYNIHYYIQEYNMEPTEFFIAFSSISSIIGNPGQCNYCAGNTYMEGLVQYRNSIGLKGLVLNLGPIRDVGAIFRDSKILNEQLKEDMINCSAIKKSILYCLKLPPISNQLIVSKITKTTIQPLINKSKFNFVINLLENGPVHSESLLITKALKLPSDQLNTFILSNIKSSLSKIIGINESNIRIDQSLTTLGIDSIAAVELKNYLDNQFDTSIPVFELTSGKSIGGLCDDLIKIINDKKTNNNNPNINIKINNNNKKSLYINIKQLINIQEQGPQSKTESDLIQERIDLLMKESSSNNNNNNNNKNNNNLPELNYNGGKDLTNQYYDFSKTKDYEEVSAYIRWLKWNPYYFTQTHITPTTCNIDGYNNCIDFSAYDYLGLSNNPEVKQAAKDAIDIYGTSVSASRLTGGQIPLHIQLEKEISNFLGVEDSIVYLGGHTANVNSIKTLFNRKDLILYDELSHNSLIEGILYSGAESIQFQHNNYNDLDNKLKSKYKKFDKILIIIEGIYSMDGDIPDLPNFIRIKNKYNCILMVDEAHSIGVLGNTGRGIRELFNVNPLSVEIWMGSLGKSFASAGGYIAGKESLIKILRYRAPGFIYSIGLCPSATAAALKSIQVLIKHPEIVEKLHYNSNYFKNLCIKEGIEIGPCSKVPSAVVSVFVGNTDKCLKVLQELRKEGVLVTPGMWPACPQGKARLRFFINSTHNDDEIYKTVMAIKKVFIQENICKFDDIIKSDILLDNSNSNNNNINNNKNNINNITIDN